MSEKERILQAFKEYGLMSKIQKDEIGRRAKMKGVSIMEYMLSENKGEVVTK